MSAEVTPARKCITGLEAVESALRETPYVYCKIDRFGDKAYLVRDVQRRNGRLLVQILEGWFTPVEIWIEVR